MALPGDGETGCLARGERAEEQAVGLALGAHDAVDAEGVAHAGPHEGAGIVQQVERGNHVQLGRLAAEPFLHLAHGLPRQDERHAAQVIGHHRVARGQRVVRAHENAPDILCGERRLVVLRQIGLAHEQAEVQAARVQALDHVLGVAAEQLEADARIVTPHLLDGPCHQVDGRGLAAADAHLARHCVAGHAELRLGATHQVHDLLRALAQAQPCVGQLHAPPAAAREQRGAQLPLQLLDLTRQRGLREVQRARRVRDGALAGDHEEVLQHPELHRPSLRCAFRQLAEYSHTE